MATNTTTGDPRDTVGYNEVVDQLTSHTYTTSTNTNGTNWLFYYDNKDLEKGQLIMRRRKIVPNPDIRFRDLFNPEPEEEILLDREEIVDEEIDPQPTPAQSPFQYVQYPPPIQYPTLVWSGLLNVGTGNSTNDNVHTNHDADIEQSVVMYDSNSATVHTDGSDHMYLTDNDEWAIQESTNRSAASSERS